MRIIARSHAGIQTCGQTCKLTWCAMGRMVCDGTVFGTKKSMSTAASVASLPVTSPLALALAKTDMWEGHAGQTQAESIRIPLLVCMSPCYQGSRVSVERIAICARRDNLGYLRLEFARSRSHRFAVSRTPLNISTLSRCAWRRR